MNIQFVNIHVSGVAEIIAHRLDTEGIVLLGGFTCAEDALKIVRRIGEVYMHRDADEDGITRLRYRAEVAAKPSFDGFSRNALFPHTDVSSLDEPPAWLLQICMSSSAQGGRPILCNGQTLARRLAQHHPQLFVRTQAKNAAMFPGPGGSPTPRAIFERSAANRYTVRFRRDELIYFNIWLASEFRALQHEIDAASFPIDLKSGHAYLINNRWWLHGREAFVGAREMWRVLFNTHPATSPVPRGFVLSDPVSSPKEG